MLMVLFVLMAVVFICGCGKKKTEEPEEPDTDSTQEEQIPEPIPEPEPEPEPAEPEENHENDIRSGLTGLWIPKEYAGLRPFTVMLNNIEVAYPQSGTAEAGILYEILAEGGISRFMGVFDYIAGDRIGSVRSARHYFVDFSEEYDAIFVHVGQTKYALSKIKELGTDDLNGLYGEGNVVFYRDNGIRAPHNCFASSEGIQKGIEYKKLRTELKEGHENHFQFSLEEKVALTGADAVKAEKVTIPFSAYDTPYLLYDSETETYHRYGYGKEQVDPVNGEALAFTTAIIQLVKEYNIDKNGYQTMDIERSSGTGYYITGGKAVPIYWKKNGAKDQTVYSFDQEGTKELVLNPGKIYIAVFPSYQADKIVLE